MKKLSRVAALVLVFVLLVPLFGCRRAVVDPIDDNYRVFYEIFVGSFSDSDGDGCGDLRGIINRIDYLNDGDINSGKSLGVQGIWLSPIFTSPSYHKYDCADYYEIDPQFGTEEDLVELLEVCHERNIKVILDLVLNHTSDENEWFRKFTAAHQNSDADDPYYDYYSYSTVANRRSGHVYTGISGCLGEMVECNFSTDMPELNYDNEDVRQSAVDVAKYYLGLGVDGFRFDAVKYIYYTDTAANTAFWDWYMGALTADYPDIYCVGECWSADSEVLEYCAALNCFNFSAAQGEGFFANAAKRVPIARFTNYIESYTRRVSAANPDGMMISFISNHDMDRSAGYVTLAAKRAHMTANLYILCPGSPFIYYGEEIGMKGTRGAANTDANRRLAMLWGDGDTVRDPVGATYDASKQTNGTVESHIDDRDSLYNYYRRLIALRGKYPEIARGEYKALIYNNSTFGGFLISYNGAKTWLFHNTSANEQTVDLSDCETAFECSFTELCDCIGQGGATLEGTILTIAPQTSAILK